MWTVHGRFGSADEIKSCRTDSITQRDSSYHLELFAWCWGGGGTGGRPLGAPWRRGRREAEPRPPGGGQVEEEAEEEPDGQAREEVGRAEARREPRLLVLRRGAGERVRVQQRSRGDWWQYQRGWTPESGGCVALTFLLPPWLGFRRGGAAMDWTWRRQSGEAVLC